MSDNAYEYDDLDADGNVINAGPIAATIDVPMIDWRDALYARAARG